MFMRKILQAGEIDNDKNEDEQDFEVKDSSAAEGVISRAEKERSKSSEPPPSPAHTRQKSRAASQGDADALHKEVDILGAKTETSENNIAKAECSASSPTAPAAIGNKNGKGEASRDSIVAAQENEAAGIMKQIEEENMDKDEHQTNQGDSSTSREKKSNSSRGSRAGSSDSHGNSDLDNNKSAQNSCPEPENAVSLEKFENENTSQLDSSEQTKESSSVDEAHAEGVVIASEEPVNTEEAQFLPPPPPQVSTVERETARGESNGESTANGESSETNSTQPMNLSKNEGGVDLADGNKQALASVSIKEGRSRTSSSASAKSAKSNVGNMKSRSGSMASTSSKMTAPSEHGEESLTLEHNAEDNTGKEPTTNSEVDDACSMGSRTSSKSANAIVDVTDQNKTALTSPKEGRSRATSSASVKSAKSTKSNADNVKSRSGSVASTSSKMTTPSEHGEESLTLEHNAEDNSGKEPTTNSEVDDACSMRSRTSSKSANAIVDVADQNKTALTSPKEGRSRATSSASVKSAKPTKSNVDTARSRSGSVASASGITSPSALPNEQREEPLTQVNNSEKNSDEEPTTNSKVDDTSSVRSSTSSKNTDVIVDVPDQNKSVLASPKAGRSRTTSSASAKSAKSNADNLKSRSESMDSQNRPTTPGAINTSQEGELARASNAEASVQKMSVDDQEPRSPGKPHLPPLDVSWRSRARSLETPQSPLPAESRQRSQSLRTNVSPGSSRSPRTGLERKSSRGGSPRASFLERQVSTRRFEEVQELLSSEQVKQATKGKASYSLVDEGSDEDVTPYSDEEETFMVRNLDTGELERVTLSQMINGGVVTGLMNGSFDEPEEDAQYEEVGEEEGNTARFSEDVEGSVGDASSAGQAEHRVRIRSQASGSLGGDSISEIDFNALPSISLDGIGGSDPEATAEPVNVSPMHRAGAMLLRSFLLRQARSRVIRAWGRWEAQLLIEAETQRLVEEVSAKEEECTKLNEENTALRVQQANGHVVPSTADGSHVPDLKPINRSSFPEAPPIPSVEDGVNAKLNSPKGGIMSAGNAIAAALAAKAGVAPPQAPEAQTPRPAPKEEPKSNAGDTLTRAQVEAMLREKGVDPAVIFGDQATKGSGPVKLKDDPRYGKFFKMLAVKVPAQAIKNKMEAEGLDPEMIDKDPNDPAPPMPGEETKEDGPIVTKLKDDPRYGKFFKMLAVKVPVQAIKNKMEAEGLDPDMIDKNPEDPAPPMPGEEKKDEAPAAIALKDDPRYGKFFKMLAVKVPVQAIKNKMEAEGLDPDMIDKDPNDPAPPMPGEEKKDEAPAAVALKDDPRYGKFFKMLAVRVPPQAIKNKMEAEGLDPDMIDKDPNDPAPPMPGAEGGAKAKVPTVALKDDPRYGKFFKMLAVRVPPQAIKNKMEAEGLDPSMIDKDPDHPAPPMPGDDDDDEGEDEPTVALKDDSRYGKFFKMLAVKVPPQAIKNKMIAEGLDPNMLDRDPNDPAPAVPKEGGKKMIKLKDDPRYSPFFKMLAVKVPRGAVEVKMQSKGLDPKYLDMDPETEIPAEGEEDKDEPKKAKKAKKKKKMVKLKDDERYSPFFKMLAVMVPRGAVELKMRNKGLDPKYLDLDPESEIPAEGEDDGDDEGDSGVKMVKLKDDERYSPFIKMLAVKVPRGAVEVKMTSKGLDPKYLDMDPETLIPAAGEEGKETKKVEKAKPKPKPVEKKPDKIVRRKLHWRKVTKQTLSKLEERTLWNKTSKFMFEQREVKEMNDYFTFNMSEQERRKEREKAAKAKEEGADGAKKKKAKKEAKKQLLDAQRSNNISIVLSRMKGHGIDSKMIRQCLYTLEVPEAVSHEDVRSTLGLLPTPEEEKTLQAFEGDRNELEKAEAYFLDLMDIPRYKQRVNCFLYKLKFDESYDEAHIDFEVLSKACKQILESKKLRRILEIILALGNFLNEGEDAPPTRLAEGFMLDSLSKLRTVKSYQSKTTALHYMVMLIQTRQVELVSFIKSETDDVRSASNVSLTNALAQLQVLENGIKALENEVKVVANVLEDPAKRDAMTEEDQAFALGLNRFYKEASSSLEELRKTATETEDSFKSVLDYFCEDGATTSEVLFRMLQGFFADFELALNENDAARQKYLRVKRQKEKLEKAANEKKANDAKAKDKAGTKTKSKMKDPAGKDDGDDSAGGDKKKKKKKKSGDDGSDGKSKKEDGASKTKKKTTKKTGEEDDGSSEESAEKNQANLSKGSGGGEEGSPKNGETDESSAFDSSKPGLADISAAASKMLGRKKSQDTPAATKSASDDVMPGKPGLADISAAASKMLGSKKSQDAPAATKSAGDDVMPGKPGLADISAAASKMLGSKKSQDAPAATKSAGDDVMPGKPGLADISAAASKMLGSKKSQDAPAATKSAGDDVMPGKPGLADISAAASKMLGSKKSQDAPAATKSAGDDVMPGKPGLADISAAASKMLGSKKSQDAPAATKSAGDDVMPGKPGLADISAAASKMLGRKTSVESSSLEEPAGDTDAPVNKKGSSTGKFSAASKLLGRTSNAPQPPTGEVNAPGKPDMEAISAAATKMLGRKKSSGGVHVASAPLEQESEVKKPAFANVTLKKKTSADKLDDMYGDEKQVSEFDATSGKQSRDPDAPDSSEFIMF